MLISLNNAQHKGDVDDSMVPAEIAWSLGGFGSTARRSRGEKKMSPKEKIQKSFARKSNFLVKKGDFRCSGRGVQTDVLKTSECSVDRGIKNFDEYPITNWLHRLNYIL